MEDISMSTAPSPGTDAADVAAYFDTLRTRHLDTQLRGLIGTCRFDIQSAGSWLLVVNDGYIDIRQGNETAGSEVNNEVRCTAHELLRVVRGEQDAFTAVLQGRLHVSGNLALVQLLCRIRMY
jgi:hypothetical protein